MMYERETESGTARARSRSSLGYQKRISNIAAFEKKNIKYGKYYKWKFPRKIHFWRPFWMQQTNSAQLAVVGL